MLAMVLIELEMVSASDKDTYILIQGFLFTQSNDYTRFLNASSHSHTAGIPTLLAKAR
jgi:hypothetical protein